MILWEKYISVALASTIKFIGGPLAGFALGLTWVETALATWIGMMFTVIIVTFLGDAIRIFIARYRKQKLKAFSKRTRLAVKVWAKLGINGIACLTPIIFTPIGGTFLALSFKVSRFKVLLAMCVWGGFWAIVQTWILYLIK